MNKNKQLNQILNPVILKKLFEGMLKYFRYEVVAKNLTQVDGPATKYNLSKFSYCYQKSH